MTSHTVTNGDVEIVYETFGPTDGEPMLLIAGTAGQLLDWPEQLCGMLVERGFAVTRFDNRDVGLSTHFTAAGRPNQLKMLLRPAAAAVYRLEDMAEDALAVMDALGWASAHIVGVSQGGMIAQTIAVAHPDRVRTLTSISSAPAPRSGQPKPRALLKLIKIANPKRVKTREDLAQYMVDLQQVAGSPGYPADEEQLREHGRRSFDRGGIDLASVQRQTAAIASSADRRAQLASLQMPTLVLHGDADQIILPEGGRDTADAIPGARLITYPGLGHDLPHQLWPTITNELATIAGLDTQDSRPGLGTESAGR